MPPLFFSRSSRFSSFFFIFSALVFSGTGAFAQTGCPTVSVNPSSVDICNGCTNLTAAVQGTVETTSYSVAPTPYFPFSYNTGTPVLVNIDDAWSSPIDLPFCFQFYGNTYNQLVIGSNGIISFDASLAGGFCNWSLVSSPGLPDAGLPPNSIMAPYQDIDPTYMGSINWQIVGSSPCRAFVISTYQVPYYGDPNSFVPGTCNSPLFATSQIILYETTNIIDICIKDKPVCLGWNNGFGIEGIQNATGTAATVVAGRNNTAWVANNDAMRFTPTGVPQYNFTWYAPGNIAISNSTSITVCPSDTTIYTATVVNNTCAGPITVSDNVSVNFIGIQSINISTTAAFCSGNTGTATANVVGSSSSYSYLWSPGGQTTQTATGLSGGTYKVNVTSTNGCSDSATVTIPASPALTFSVSGIAVACSGTNSGSASVSVLTGTPPYTYSWNPSGQTTSTATGLSAGTYTVTVTDLHSCSHVSTVTITSPSPLTHSFSPPTNASCFGYSNGSATVNALGGTPSYTYSWNPSGQTTSTATGLSAGTYTVTVTDLHACSQTDTITITSPPLLTHSFSATTNASCFGYTNGGTTVNVSGGTPSYTYSWNPSGQTTSIATNLSAGTYTVTVTDIHACSQIDTITITSPLPLTHSFSPTTNVSCFGFTNGSTTVSVSGGTPAYAYSWNPSGQTNATATGLSAGTYTVTITDLHSCSQTDSITITSPALLTHSFPPNTNASCFGYNDGSATVNVLGGTPAYTYLWSDAQITQTATGLAAGTYSIVVTDAHGCSFLDSALITAPPPLIHSFSGLANVDCFGNPTGAATINMSGGTPGYSYSWNSIPLQTTATASTLYAGVFKITATDAHGCSLLDSVMITTPTGLGVFSPEITNVRCFGDSTGSASITPFGGTPGYNYLWTPTNQITSIGTGLPIGIYTITITDNNGCIIHTLAQITEPPLLTATSNKTNILCSGDSTGTAAIIVAGGSAPYTYLWSPNAETTATITGISAGSYSVQVTDSLGCPLSSSFLLTQPLAPISVISSFVDVLCNPDTSGSATVTVTGGTPGYVYLWNNGQAGTTISNLPAGNFSVMITDVNGCRDSSVFTITQPPLLSFTSSHVNILCFGDSTGSAAVSVTGGVLPYTYSWNPVAANIPVLNGLPAGIDTVLITDANGCKLSHSFILTQPALPLSISSSFVNILCNPGGNGSASIVVTGGTPSYHYLWNNGQTTTSISNLPAGNYSVMVTDTNGCLDSSTILITQPPLFTTAISPDTVICSGMSLTESISASGGTPGYSYLWMPGGETTSTIITTPVFNITYTVQVSDGNGCTSAPMNTSVTVVPMPTASFTVSPGGAVFFPETLCFVADPTNASSWLWNFGDNTNGSTNSVCHDYSKMGSYCVTLIESSNGGCSDTTERCVVEVGAFIPNVFSPNGDGINDTFFIGLVAEGITHYSCEIYDRWGLKLIELVAPMQEWEGRTISGSPLSDGTYYYVLSVSWGNDLNIHKEGFITLVR